MLERDDEDECRCEPCGDEEPHRTTSGIRFSEERCCPQGGQRDTAAKGCSMKKQKGMPAKAADLAHHQGSWGTRQEITKREIKLEAFEEKSKRPKESTENRDNVLCEIQPRSCNLLTKQSKCKGILGACMEEKSPNGGRCQ